MGKTKKEIVERFAWSPNGDLAIVRGTSVAVSTVEGVVRAEHDFGAAIENIAIHGDLVVAYADGALRIADPKGIRALASTDFAASVELSPDGATLAVVTYESQFGPRMLTTWNTRTWEPDGSAREVGGGAPFLSLDARLLAAATIKKVTIYDVASGSELGQLPTVGSVPSLLAWSRGVTRMAGGNVDGMVQLWDVEAKRAVGSIDAFGDSVMTIDVSADGTLVAAATSDGPMKLWSFDTRKSLAKSKDVPANVEAVAFDPQGRYLAVLTKGVLELRDAKTLANPRKL